MTLDQFFERLEAEAPKHRWELWEGGLLRTVTVATVWPRCPIEVLVDGGVNSPGAAATIGLSNDLRLDIQDAADHNPGHDPALRRRLLECCGLEQP